MKIDVFDYQSEDRSLYEIWWTFGWPYETSVAMVACGLDFFGVDRVLFASDSPFDPEGGTMNIRVTIEDVDGLDVSEEDRRKIYHDNAVRLLKLGTG